MTIQIDPKVKHNLTEKAAIWDFFSVFDVASVAYRKHNAESSPDYPTMKLKQGEYDASIVFRQRAQKLLAKLNVVSPWEQDEAVEIQLDLAGIVFLYTRYLKEIGYSQAKGETTNYKQRN